jgi:copper transport protein
MKRASSWRTTLRAALVVAVTVAALVTLAAPAVAHSALESSDPAAGSSVPTSPRHIALTFSEDPDAELSLVGVIDSGGATVPGVSAPEAVPGERRQLRVTPSRPLDDGVYTVNWRVVSAVDGHVEQGAFAFGIGESPAPGSEVVVELLQTSPWVDVMATAGTWLLYAGLILLVGAASTSLLVYGGRLPAGGDRALRISVFGALVGLCLMIWSQRVLVGAPSLLPLFLTREGKLLLGLGGALVVCAGAVVVVDLWPARWSLWLLGAAGAVAMLVHVAGGHAASPSSVWALNIAVQWVHLTAIGVWVGGLFWLLLGLRGRGRAERAAAVGVFTRVATVTLVIVLATGLGRALGEVGSLGALVDTGYGTTLLIKIGLVVGLVGLGALNHFFWVPAVRRGDGEAAGRRFGLNSRGELVVALTVLAATAVLSGLAPARVAVAASAAKPVPQAQASGQDYATTVRVHLTVTPGAAGESAYVAWVDDYDSGDPLTTVSAVRLECSLPAEPSVSAVEIPLRRAADGSWRGRGLELAIAGLWRVTATIEKTAEGVTVPLSLRIRPAAAD